MEVSDYSVWDFLLEESLHDLGDGKGLINEIVFNLAKVHQKFEALIDECLEMVDEEDSEDTIVFPPHIFRKDGLWRAKAEIPPEYRQLTRGALLISKAEIDSEEEAKAEVNKDEKEEDDNEDENDKKEVNEGENEEEEEEVEGIEFLKECSVCGKALRNRKAAQRHFQARKCKRPPKVKFPEFQCLFCDNVYITFISYRDHVKASCPLRPPDDEGGLCEKCKRYVYPNVDHSCEPFYKCNLCPYKSFNQSCYRQHYRAAHLKLVNSFCCEVCGKTFDCKNRLNIHTVTHTKERSFLCTECGKGFGRKSVLDVHMSVHFSKKVPCDICGKIFAHAKLLQKHKVTQHPKNGIFTREQCPHCPSSFRSKFYMLKHIKHKHEDSS